MDEESVYAFLAEKNESIVYVQEKYLEARAKRWGWNLIPASNSDYYWAILDPDGVIEEVFRSPTLASAFAVLAGSDTRAVEVRGLENLIFTGTHPLLDKGGAAS